MSETPLELGLVVDGDDTWLVAPAVGLFTEALAAGALAAPGARAGTLLRLGRPHPVHLPTNLGGTVLESCASRVHEPVGYGTRLYRLGPLQEDGARNPLQDGAASGGQADGARRGDGCDSRRDADRARRGVARGHRGGDRARERDL